MKFLITVAALFAIAECRRHLCDDGTRPICSDGSKEKVKCSSGKEAYRSCEKVERIEEQKFWMFEGVMALIAGVSYGALFLRQKQMDHRMYQKIQRQIAAGV